MKSGFMSHSLQTPYQVLGLPQSAGDAEMKQAYFQLVRQYPPEKCPKEFREIRSAYEKVSTPQARLETDMTLPQAPPSLPVWDAPGYDPVIHREDLILLATELGMAGVSMQEDFRVPQS